ncbi:MAG: NfeD family protein [Chloroflexota bacterium]
MPRTVSLFRLIRLVIAGLAVLGGVSGLAVGARAQDTASVVVVPFVGVVNPVLAGYVDRAIAEAEEAGAALVVIEMDTPGGLDSSMRQINRRILGAGVPVAVYVAPSGARAGSAGVYITYAAHIAAMAPGTNIGSATPVAMGESGEQQMSDEMRAKVSNDAAAYIRSLAEQRRRNSEWAEQAVRQGVNVHAEEALGLGVIGYVAPDLRSLLQQIDGTSVETTSGRVTLRTANAEVRRLEMNAIESFLHVITDPTIAYIILSLGTMGLFFELSNPGSIFPGVIGGICLLLGLYALGSLPINYAGLLFMGLALLLLVADILTPTHGVLTAGGLISFVLGSMLLINAPASAPFLQISVQAIGAVVLCMAAFSFFVVGSVARTRNRKVVTGREGLIGSRGIVRVALEPRGMVFVESELWSAVSDAGPIEKDVEIEVTGLDGLLLHVRPIESANESVALGGSQEPTRVGAQK